MAENKAETPVANTDGEKQGEEQVKTGPKVYKAEEVKQHNTAEDCWVVINGKVYDVTKYLDDHPGGPEIICDVAGDDASEEFEDTGHSADARNILKEYLVGDAEGGAKKTSTGGSKAGASGSNNAMLVLGFLVALLAAAYAMFGDKLAELGK